MSCSRSSRLSKSTNPDAQLHKATKASSTFGITGSNKRETPSNTSHYRNFNSFLTVVENSERAKIEVIGAMRLFSREVIDENLWKMFAAKRRSRKGSIDWLIRLAAPLGLLLAATVAVHHGGDLTSVLSDLFYAPILLAAFLFGLPGGLFAGLAAGMLSTPFPLLHPSGFGAEAALRIGLFVLFGSLVGIAYDAFQRKFAVLRDRARRSAVTGLPNSGALERDLNDLIDKDRGVSEGFILAEVQIPNVDDLMMVFGDRVLRDLLPRVAASLRSAAPSSPHAYQMHYDRFAVVSTDAQFGSIGSYCESLLAALPQSVELDGLPLRVFGSGRIGIAHFPTHGQSGADLIRASRFALRAAAERKERYAIYDKGTDGERRMMLQRLSELRHAIDNDELVFHYQPKLDLRTNSYTSAEALVRWNHPSGEMLAPSMFLPFAENTDVITRVSAWGLKTAIAQLAAWERDGIELNLGIAINLSAMDLRTDATVRTLKELLALYAVDPARLEIEVTETSIIEDIELAKRHLEQIKALGVRIAIDDFGTGHAGLAQLRDLPVDSLKIDQVFIKHMLNQTKDAMIVRAAIRLGHNLGIEVVAEGIETREALDRVREYGCDIAQGYAVARPMPESELRKLVPLRRGPPALKRVRTQG